jgi:hypothetical protein
MGLTCLSAFVGTLAYLIFRHGAVAAVRRLIGRPSADHTSGASNGDRAEPVRVPLGPYFLLGTIAAALFPVVQR